jgi:hypothetical protein
MNLTAEGEIWVCTSGIRKFRSVRYNNEVSYFRDDYITKIDAETGTILFDKSISEILTENGYSNFVYGFTTNRNFEDLPDPIHLNDIEPVMYDGLFWEQGDLFISIRNKSLVFMYRPRTNEIIHLLYGPFLNQHDVDIIADGQISIFNNNTTDLFLHTGLREMDLTNVDSTEDLIGYSEILIYNFRNSTYTKCMNELLIKEKVFTPAEGLHEFLSNGDLFIENSGGFRIQIFNQEQILYRKQFHTDNQAYVHILNWTRLYENINF